MGFLLRIWAIFVVAAKRLLSQRGLALATVLGLVVSVALVMSIPLYADAVYYNILQDELTESDPDATVQRPPFAYMFRYIGSTYGPKEWEDFNQLDTYLTGPGMRTLGLPHKQTVRYFKTENFRFFPTEDLAYADIKDPLEWVNFGSASNFEQHITLREGNFPEVADSNVDSTVDVLINAELADELGLQVGEEYETFRRSEVDDTVQVTQIPVRIAGIWEATDATEDYWFYNPSSLRKVLMVPEATLQNRISPVMNGEITLALWYLVMDGSNIHASQVGNLLARANLVQQRVASLLTDTRLDISPVEPLQRYWRSARLLTILLYAFSVPIVGLLLAFIGLVVGLAVGRQRNEISVLRSRGATMGQIVGIAGLEALLLAGVALAAGIPVSQWIAQAIGATRSFLNFTVNSDLRVGLTLSTLRFGLAAVAVTFVAQVMPSFGAARHTIVTYKQEQARSLRSPWWQRMWLDVLLLIPAVYGAYLLRQQGSITLPGSTPTTSDPFQNPLLFLVPALGTLALTLLLLRILPLVMRAIAWIASKTSSVGLLLAARYLARNPGFYTAPLVLLILTLSLSAFTASLAQTLDNNLYDQTYYKIGADARLVELGQTSSSPSAPNAEGGGEEARWVFVPVSEHLKVPAIKGATRVGDFDARIQLQGSWKEAHYIGIDRVNFAQVAFWRRDFASASLGSMMNALAVVPEGVLMPRQFMREQAIKVGDPLQVQVMRYGQRADMTLQVVGELDYFPTWYPEDGPLLVGNLEYFFEQAGGQLPYDVWVKTAPGTDYDQLARDLRKIDLNVMDWRAAETTIAQNQRLPERQGLFGVLSVGFLAAALLTVLGFLLYALFSFRRRFIELGTLRAIGLSPGQMTGFLAWELAFMILLSLGAGTALGALVSEVFIPYLQIGNDATALIPPFVVEIAWPAIFRIYILFGLLFAVALSILAVLLLRMKIFQAIKLGETV